MMGVAVGLVSNLVFVHVPLPTLALRTPGCIVCGKEAVKVIQVTP